MAKQKKRGKWEFPVKGRARTARSAGADTVAQTLERLRAIEVELERSKALMNERDQLITALVRCGVNLAPYGALLVDNFVDSKTGDFKNVQWKSVAFSRWSLEWAS